MTEQALDCLYDVMMHGGDEASARVAAANIILQNGYGKPPLRVDIHRRTETTVTYRTIAELRASLERDGIPREFWPPAIIADQIDDAALLQIESETSDGEAASTNGGGPGGRNGGTASDS